MSVDKLVDSAQLDSALTSVANAIRIKGGTSASLAFPDDFISAINAISGGGGTNIEIGIQTTTIPTILNMFYALEQGAAKTGEFTMAQSIPNTEVEIFDTGLSTVNGIMIADESQATLNTSNSPEATWFSIVFEPTGSGSGAIAFTRLTIQMAYGTNQNGVYRKFLNRCTWRVDSGKLYATGEYNKSTSYTPFLANHTYRWVAW